MKKTLTLLLIPCAFGTAVAQQATVKGTISDKTEQKDLSNAVIAVLKKSDSTMQAFTRSHADGAFIIKNLPPGDYLLMVTYPKFADFVEPFSLPKDSTRKDTLLAMNRISLIRKSDLLKEVIVSQKVSAIRMKGDTLEFKADSFKVKEGANVEELLKKLPGIQVNSKGEITAQGQKVRKVLVDGEEFFGDDPTLVTQNLRADMVDKVQLFDKTSDRSAFTGIDDGERSKTINLKLKDDKKNGYFGKANAGAGSNGYYDNQVMLNLFKKKQKLALYGIHSNTGKTGLNWDERDKYGQSFAGLLDYDEATGGFSYSGSGTGMDDIENWDGRYNGQGYPSVKTGGIHYNNKWNDDKQSVNGNYKVMQLSVVDTSNTVSQYLLPDSNGSKNQYSNQVQYSDKQIMRHRADGNYEIKFDSSSSIKILADGSSDHKVTNSHFDSETLGTDSALVNRGIRNASSTSDTRNFNSSLLWQKKLAKKGRTVSMSFEERYMRSSSEGLVFAQNDFYKNDTVNQRQVTDQLKNYHSENTTLGGKIAYTEPLSAASFIAANYGITLNNSSSNRSSFNKSSTGKYTELDPVYSNDYKLNTLTHYGGLTYSLIRKKLKISAGSNIGFTHFEQTDTHADTSIARRFVNWYPRATFTYSFSAQKRLMAQYNGYTAQPTVQQIQPIRTNDDPLNISIGNPGLKPAFNNGLWLSYNDYKVLNERYIYASINYNSTLNNISSKDNVDTATGKRTYQSVNLNGNYSIGADIGYNFKWKAPAINIGFNSRYSHNRSVNIVNEILNATSSDNYTLGGDIGKWKDKKYEIGVSGSATYTNSISSIQKSYSTSFWTYNIGPHGSIDLPLKISVGVNADINLRQKTPQFQTNNNVVLLNAAIEKKMLKKDQLVLRLSGNDLLNQNIGLNRYTGSNNITQTTYTTIRRYFMLSLVWNFTKMVGAAPKP